MNTTRKTAFYLRSADLSRVCSDEVAEHFEISSTTLRRRLTAECTCYSALLYAERKRRCDALIDANEIADVSSVARAVGYTDNSASRIFKEFYGRTITGA